MAEAGSPSSHLLRASIIIRVGMWVFFERTNNKFLDLRTKGIIVRDPPPKLEATPLGIADTCKQAGMRGWEKISGDSSWKKIQRESETNRIN